ncbi:MAG: hypothetical protein MZU91_01330 [Desulfosudis oleivorans]|nr:hypothetical protein [Desulfosudis oleivorans]
MDTPHCYNRWVYRRPGHNPMKRTIPRVGRSKRRRNTVSRLKAAAISLPLPFKGEDGRGRGVACTHRGDPIPTLAPPLEGEGMSQRDGSIRS